MPSSGNMQHIPLAERVRPKLIEEIVGQSHLLSPQSPIKKMLEHGQMVSAIFWGRPGTGKTTLARAIAQYTHHHYIELSATLAGVADIRKIIELSEKEKVLLFLDEIHRFNKNQQDILLPIVESGKIILIGATTENPSFEVNKALLSRLQVFEIRPLDDEAMHLILQRSIATDEVLKTIQWQITSTKALFDFAGGDARKMLGIVDMMVKSHTSPEDVLVIDDKEVSTFLQQKMLQYDKSGEDHYDTISAFIKSIRGSDPNAALYWFARMLVAGEDLLFIARRLVILAAEDIGLANPNALILANSTFDAVHKIGMPEARIILSNCIVYLATSEKSNASYVAVEQAIALVKKTPQYPVPLHLRNAPTQLMKEFGYGKSYQYAHDYEKNFVKQEFFPEALSGTKFYVPQSNTREVAIKKFLDERWGSEPTTPKR